MQTKRFLLLLLIASFSSPCLAALPASAPVRVLIWDEQQPEQKQAYGGKFLGETIAAYLAEQEGVTVKTTNLSAPEQGLAESALDGADVLIWWGHKKHGAVQEKLAERVVARVTSGRLGLIALHSAHWSKPFVRLMQERAKSDALQQIPAAQRAAAKFEYRNTQPIGHMVRADAPLTPFLVQKEDVWQLTLPGCIFPAYRADGAPSHVTTLLPQHPIAAGLPAQWTIPRTEMYADPFHVPKPDAVIFEEKWDKGEHFSSGCAWNVGQGRVFYFRPGHETFAVYQQPEPLLVILNAARWAAPRSGSTSTPKE